MHRLIPEMKPHWSGVFPAITTQMFKDGSLDLDATAVHMEALIKSGVTGFVMLGSLGENQSLTAEEKRRVMDGERPGAGPERRGRDERHGGVPVCEGL
jgi:hypothetical protein